MKGCGKGRVLVYPQGLKCLRENSSFVGRKNGSLLDCSYSVAPTGLEICFLASPRIAFSPGAAGGDFILHPKD